jgi:hypothetical protein
MVFSLISYQRAARSERMANESNARSIKNENQAREIEFARRRSEVLGYVTAGKAAYMAALRKLKAYQDAALEAGATLVGPAAEPLIAGANESIAKLTEIEKEIESDSAAGKTHEQLMTLMDTRVDFLKRFTDPLLIAEGFGPSFDQFERNIRLVSVHKEVAKQLGQAS